jgi:hypothetical protein
VYLKTYKVDKIITMVSNYKWSLPILSSYHIFLRVLFIYCNVAMLSVVENTHSQLVRWLVNKELKATVARFQAHFCYFQEKNHENFIQDRDLNQEPIEHESKALNIIPPQSALNSHHVIEQLIDDRCLMQKTNLGRMIEGFH